MGFYIFLVLLAIVVLLVLANLKKIGPMIQKLKVFYSEVAFEMGKVIWPTRDEVIHSTVLVGVLTAVLTAVVMIVDRMVGFLVQLVF